MKVFAISLAVTAMVSAAPALVLAQQAPATAPARPAAPASPARPAAPAAPALPAPLPFPAGAKVGFVNLQAIAQYSTEGKAAAAKVSALVQKKQTEAADKAKTLAANQQKLETGGAVMSDTARAQLQKDIEKAQVDAQRFDQDAQAEVNELQQELQDQFQAKLMPILEALSKEKGLQVLFSAGDSGVIWAEPGIDLTIDAVNRLDGKK